MLREAGVDSPVAGPVGVGGRIAGHPAADTHVPELSGLGAQAGPDVAKAASVGELGECHASELIGTGERLHVPVTTVSRDAAVEHMPREMSHDLGEDQAAGIHRVFLPAVAVHGGSENGENAVSSRQLLKRPINLFTSVGYSM